MMVKVRAVILATFLGVLGGASALAQTDNTAYGTGALASDTTGSENSAFGYQALSSNTSGGSNSAIGAGALEHNSTGIYNTAIGYDAMLESTSGTANIGIGAQTLFVANGSANIAIGTRSGSSITKGSYNIDISNAGIGGDNGVIRLGTANLQTSFYAAGIDGVQISEGVPVYINSSGQLGTVNSSLRFKQDVHDMAGASSRLFELRPVTYRYKQPNADGSRPLDYGLIAEEVARVYPDMVTRDASGQIQTVQYQKLTPMLLNEVQKQHRLLETQQQTIERLEERLSAIEAALATAKAKDEVAKAE